MKWITEWKVWKKHDAKRKIYGMKDRRKFEIEKLKEHSKIPWITL